MAGSAQTPALSIVEGFRTYEWTKQFEPIEFTSTTMQQILQPRLVSYKGVSDEELIAQIETLTAEYKEKLNKQLS